MSMGKATPGPWKLEFIQSWPFGVRIKAGDKTILAQNAFCTSSTQKTRRDCELGVGFDNPEFCSNQMAQKEIAEQDANAALIAAAPELLEFARKYLALAVCICHFQKYVGGEIPCDRCKVEALVAKAEGRDKS